jgi:hypothetical protein
VGAADEHERLRTELDEVFDRIARDYAGALASAGADLDDLGGVEAVDTAVRAVLPRPNRLAARLGPVYTTGQLQRLLPGSDAAAITDQAVRNRLAAHTLIGAKSRDGRWVFPAWQFRVRSGRLTVRDDVICLWRRLPVGEGTFDDWTLLAWMTGPRRDLDGLSPLEWLDRHGDDARLTRAAGRVHARGAA